MDLLPLMPQVKACIDNDLPRFCTVEALVAHFNADRYALHECFTYTFRQSPEQYIQCVRLTRLKAMVLDTGGAEGHLYYAIPLGFKSGSALRSFVGRVTDMPFSEFKQAVLGAIAVEV